MLLAPNLRVCSVDRIAALSVPRNCEDSLFICRVRHGMIQRDVMKRISVYRVAGVDTEQLI
jgi:hypothetical protein